MAGSSSNPIFLARTALLSVCALLNLYFGYSIFSSSSAFGRDFSAKSLQSDSHISPDLSILIETLVKLVGYFLHAFGWCYLYGAMTSNIKEQSPILIGGSICKALAAWGLHNAVQQLQQLNETSEIQSAITELSVVWKFDAVVSTLFFILYVAGHVIKTGGEKKATAPEKKIK